MEIRRRKAEIQSMGALHQAWFLALLTYHGLGSHLMRYLISQGHITIHLAWNMSGDMSICWMLTNFMIISNGRRYGDRTLKENSGQVRLGNGRTERIEPHIGNNGK